MLETSKTGILMALIFMLLLTSCAYHGKIDSGFYTPEKAGEKIPISVALNVSGENILPITNGSMGDSYYVETKDAILSSANKVLATVFDTDGKPPVFTVEPSFRTFFVSNNSWNSWNVNQIYDACLCLVFRRYDTGEVYWQSCDTQRINVTPSAKSNALAVITGASLLILSPLTIPASTQVDGNRQVALASEYLTRSLNIIQADIVKNRKIFITSPDATESPSSKGAMKILSDSECHNEIRQELAEMKAQLGEH